MKDICCYSGTCEVKGFGNWETDSRLNPFSIMITLEFHQHYKSTTAWLNTVKVPFQRFALLLVEFFLFFFSRKTDTVN